MVELGKRRVHMATQLINLTPQNAYVILLFAFHTTSYLRSSSRCHHTCLVHNAVVAKNANICYAL